MFWCWNEIILIISMIMGFVGFQHISGCNWQNQSGRLQYWEEVRWEYYWYLLVSCRPLFLIAIFSSSLLPTGWQTCSTCWNSPDPASTLMTADPVSAGAPRRETPMVWSVSLTCSSAVCSNVTQRSLLKFYYVSILSTFGTASNHLLFVLVWDSCFSYHNPCGIQGLVLLSLAIGEEIDESNLEIPTHFPSPFQDFLNK